jgi:acylglycerol lipase
MMEIKASALEYRDGYIDSLDGVRLYYREWIPSGRDVGVVVLFIHGIGLHGSSPPYGEKILIRQLLDKGTAFYSIDLRGHGRSGGSVEGVSGHTLLQDVDCHVNDIKKLHKNARVFLYGHDFGGMLSLYYASTYRQNVRGVIVSGYSKRLSEGVRRALRPGTFTAFRDWLSERLYHRPRKLEFVSPSGYVQLCGRHGMAVDEGILRSLEQSGGPEKRIEYGEEFFSACGAGMEDMIAKNIRVPTLMVFARKDPFFDVRGAYEILLSISSFDKELIQVDAAGHYDVIEAGKEAIAKWLLARA